VRSIVMVAMCFGGATAGLLASALGAPLAVSIAAAVGGAIIADKVLG
jgi:hypothetical protein